MIDVTQTQIDEYNDTSVHKTLVLYFPEDLSAEVPVNPRYIEQESMTLKETILDKKNIEYVGCIASEFSIKVRGLQFSPKGHRVEAYVKTDDTAQIPLFKGIVDSVTTEDDTTHKTIRAYDVLYTKGQLDVASWYQGLTFPITVKDFRDSFFEYLGITQEDTTLPNDAITIAKQYDPTTLKALIVMKSICQFNGCFGIIGRDGLFHYRFIPQNTSVEEPIEPSNDFPFYKRCKHEDYYVKPFYRVQIRDSEKDAGITVGTGMYTNKYIVQNNMLAYKLDDNVKQTVATNILGVVGQIEFQPFESDTNGLPFIECGDTVSFPWSQTRSRSAITTNNKFLVLNRELKGIQALRDVYSADGEEEASDFITDLNANIQVLKQGGGGDMSDYYTKDETDTEIATQISEMETPTGFNIASVPSLPLQQDSATLYLIQSNIYVY